MNTESQSTKSNAVQPAVSGHVPAVAVVVTHRVRDFATWKKAFDKDADTRRAAGIIASHINRSTDDPNLLSVYLAATNRAKLDAFLTSPDLKATMMDAGVEGPPTIAMVKPVEDHTQKREGLYGMIATHPVADFDAWKAVYDELDTLRREMGIIGAAVNRGVEDGNLVVIYHQAESLEALQGFGSSDALKSAMQRAGVTAPPNIVFFQSAGWGDC